MDKKKGAKPAKKGKKGRRGKKKPTNDVSAEVAAENEKKELVATLVSKTDKSEEDVLAAYDKFHEKFPSGEINEIEFLKESKVGNTIRDNKNQS